MNRKAKDELLTKIQTEIMELTDKVCNVTVQVHNPYQNFFPIHGVERKLKLRY